MKIRFPFPIVQEDDHTVEVCNSPDGKPLVEINFHETVRDFVDDEVLDSAYQDLLNKVVRASVKVSHGPEDHEKKLLEIARYFLRCTDPADYDGRMADLVRSL